MFFDEWLTVLVVSLVAVISPGPNFVLAVRGSLAHGARGGLAAALGVSAGDAIHATYCMFGVGAVVSRSIVAFNVLRWAGALYLIYIGIKGLLSRRGADVDGGQADTALERSRGALFGQGVLTALLNPKATLFYLALFTQVVAPDTSLPARLLFGATGVGVAVAWYSLVALLIARPAFRQRFDAASHWVDRCTGGVLVALGLRVALAENR